MADISQLVNIMLHVDGADEFADFGDTAAETFAAATDAADTLEINMRDLADSIESEVTPSIEDVGTKFDDSLDMEDSISRAIDQAIEFGDKFKEAAGDAADDVKEKNEEAGKSAREAWSDFADKGKALWGSFKDAVGLTLDELKDTKIGGFISSAVSAFKDFGGSILGEVGGALSSIGSQALGVAGMLAGGLATAAGAAFGAIKKGLEDSFKASADFEKVMTEIATTASDEIQPQLGLIRQNILEMGKDIPLAAEGFGTITAKLLEAQVPADQLTGATEAIAKFAVATGTEAGKAADEVLRLGAKFKVPIEQTEGLTNLLAGLGDKTKGGTDAVAKALESMPFASELGLAVEFSAGLLQAMERGGVGAQRGAGDINQAIGKISKNSAAVAEALGLDADKMAAAFASGDKDSIQGAIQLVVEATGKIKPGTEEAAAAIKAMGAKGFEGFHAAGSAAGAFAKNVDEASEMMRGNSEVLGDFETKSKSLEGQLSLLSGELFDAKVAIGDELKPALQEAIEAVKPWIPMIKEFGIAVAKSVGDAVLWFIEFGRSVPEMAEKAQKAWNEFSDDLGSIFGETFGEMLKHPIDAMEAFGNAIITVLSTAGTFVADWAKNIGTGIRDTLDIFLPGAGEVIDKWTGKVKQAFGDAWDWVIDKLTKFVDKFDALLSQQSAKDKESNDKFATMMKARGKVWDDATARWVDGSKKVEAANDRVDKSTDKLGKGAAGASKEMTAAEKNAQAFARTAENMAGATHHAATKQELMRDALKRSTAAEIENRKSLDDMTQSVIRLRERQVDVGAQIKMLTEQNRQATGAEKAHNKEREDSIKALRLESIQIDSQIKKQELSIKATKSHTDTAEKNQKAVDKLAAAYAKNGTSIEKAAKSENVLIEAMKATADVTKAKLSLAETRIKSFADVAKAKFDMTARVVEAESKAMEQSMKSLGEETVEITKLMATGWNDYVKAVQNPFGVGAAKIVATFEQQMALQRELIQSQSKLAHEQAETLRFRREQQAQNRPFLFRISVDGADNAITELVDQVVTKVTTRFLAEGGTICC